MSAPTTLLKPAIEAVMKVAREGEAAEPTEPAPAQLKRYFRFAHHAQAKINRPLICFEMSVIDFRPYKHARPR